MSKTTKILLILVPSLLVVGGVVAYVLTKGGGQNGSEDVVINDKGEYVPIKKAEIIIGKLENI